MPLKAILDGEDIFSFTYDENGWNGLKKSYKDSSLEMACCGAAAIPKTSSKGLYFFAHKSNTEACTAPESPQHEYVKFLIAKAAFEAGWKVETESSGFTPDGERWQADVLCYKETGKTRIAFEVQNSRITLEEIKVRQRKYISSNVRCAWILNQKVFKISEIEQFQNKETPAFCYDLIEIGKIPRMALFNVELPIFIKGVLKGHLKWQEPKTTIDIINSGAELSVAEHECWKCGNITNSIIGFEGCHIQNGEDLSRNIFLVFRDTTLSKGYLKDNEIGAIKKHKYRSGEEVYTSFCFHCGSAQGVHQLAEEVWEFFNPYRNDETPTVKSVYTEYLSAEESGIYLECETLGHWTYHGKRFGIN